MIFLWTSGPRQHSQRNVDGAVLSVVDFGSVRCCSKNLYANVVLHTGLHGTFLETGSRVSNDGSMD